MTSRSISRSETEAIQNERRLLLALSSITTLLTLVLTVTASQLPLFDTSPQVLLPTPPHFSLRHILASAVLRWDAFHFARIAKDGYVYENEWAFLPGVAWVMRGVAGLPRLVGLLPAENALEWEDVLLGGLLASAVSIWSVLAMYDLTLLHFRSRSIALLASLLSLLPSSPVTLRLAGYTETFFTFLSYHGMLYCARRQWLRATCCFALASILRSNGILLCGFVAWGLVIEPLFEHRSIHPSRVLYAAVLCTVAISPFIYYQYHAYTLFCLGSGSPALWCNSVPPSIYTYVQARYWNVGFLRYWTLQQLPNFLLGAPPLALLFVFTLHYTRSALIPHLLTFAFPSSPSSSLRQKPSLFLPQSIAPHAIHALILSALLLFASHTQIVLRTAASMPLTYWAAAWLLVEHPRLGRWWVGWSVVWGAASCVLWAVFLPPA
ncbi:GPI mannosyltransferase 2 [Lenzites betulinus]|nr:GPI mannosyltransferase 2 [Lenzites betulinus]